MKLGSVRQAIAVAGMACVTTTAAAAAPFLPQRHVLIAPAAATSLVRFTMHVPLHDRSELQTLVRLQGSKGSPLYRHFLTPAQFRSRYGVNANDVATARATFARNRLRIVDVGIQDLTLEGAAADVARALGTTLAVAATRGTTRIVAISTPRLPTAFARANVVGLSTAVLRHTESVLVRRTTAGILATGSLGTAPHNELSPVGGYLTSDLKEAYAYPSYRSLTGKGATIAVMVDGDFYDSDMRLYFGVQNLPVPKLVRRPVDGGSDVTDPDGIETELDIQQAGGMAPGATIMHYNLPDLSETSIYDGYKAIVTDDRADVVNSSFGGCENYFDGTFVRYFGPTAIPATLYALSDLYLQGDAQGQSFVASSGDGGAFACFSPAAFRRVNPDFTLIAGVENPASDPLVTAVGGTNLTTSFDAGSSASTYVSESAFADAPGGPYPAWGSGGGESKLFARPPWQDGVGVTGNGRAVPDIAGHMGGCPDASLWVCTGGESSDLLAYRGTFGNVIGTSASSPDLAGLLGLTIEASGGRLGVVNPMIYAFSAANDRPVAYYHDSVDGDNGLGSIHLRTKPGYDEVTGVGSVIGVPFTGLLTSDVAGDPGTPSNPGPEPASNNLRTSAIPAVAPFLGVSTVDQTKSLAGRTERRVRRARLGIVTHPSFRAPAPRSFGTTTFDRIAAGIDGGAPSVASATTSVPGFDAFSGSCGCAATRLALAVSPNYVMTAVWDNFVNVMRPDGSRLAGWPKSIYTFLGVAPLDTRRLMAPHAAFDARTGRFWLTANESDEGADSTWIAVSKTDDPTGAWFVYHFDTNEPGATIASDQTGFGMDRDAIYFSGDQLDEYSATIVDSFVYALDKTAMERGAPVAARGFTHLTYGGTLADGLVPVTPNRAADERSGTFLVDTFKTTKGPISCAVRVCNGILVWSFGNPLGAQRLTGRVARTADYRSPLNFTHTDFEPLDLSIESMPDYGKGRISLVFAEGLTTGGRRTNGARFVEIAPSFSPTGTLLVKTLADQTVAPPEGRTIDFPTTAHDAVGSTYVTFSEESYDRPDAIAYVKHTPDGATTAPTVIFNATHAILNSNFDLTGYGAAAFQAGRVWSLEPYGDPTSYGSGWVSILP